eukprot:315115-Pyramimonas_sp.AAC.1
MLSWRLPQRGSQHFAASLADGGRESTQSHLSFTDIDFAATGRSISPSSRPQARACGSQPPSKGTFPSLRSRDDETLCSAVGQSEVVARRSRART